MVETAQRAKQGGCNFSGLRVQSSVCGESRKGYANDFSDDRFLCLGREHVAVSSIIIGG